MIHDLEAPNVISSEGVLETIFTEADNELLDKQREFYLKSIHAQLAFDFTTAAYQSQKLTILDLMKEFDHPEVIKYIRLFQDEL